MVIVRSLNFICRRYNRNISLWTPSSSRSGHVQQRGSFPIQVAESFIQHDESKLGPWRRNPQARTRRLQTGKSLDAQKPKPEFLFRHSTYGLSRPTHRHISRSLIFLPYVCKLRIQSVPVIEISNFLLDTISNLDKMIYIAIYCYISSGCNIKSG